MLRRRTECDRTLARQGCREQSGFRVRSSDGEPGTHDHRRVLSIVERRREPMRDLAASMSEVGKSAWWLLLLLRASHENQLVDQSITRAARTQTSTASDFTETLFSVQRRRAACADHACIGSTRLHCMTYPSWLAHTGMQIEPTWRQKQSL
ncbi:uncharacterized protein L969DRAFT_463369 [Mixia osmundae IAM 14324]|uniref:uncharacterized protein n=1 Tax=Mixia osmundae (strain CBS 9802 / IAM 14324 / JCM 22182 / KY 12970) TaxID=764103 RepID=UPI0004A54877|nr:uncharacterized protein L969DRAFT_463369 [Mixia osmundae IAM 14324]KEI39692.1 hypothetical protein L969DRAFT_463369 [Mixia osmundae IAM 14324]